MSAYFILLLTSDLPRQINGGLNTRIAGNPKSMAIWTALLSHPVITESISVCFFMFF